MHTKPSKKLLLAAAVVIMLNFTNCGKYDEGPSFSLVPKTSRLVGEWEVIRVDNESIAPLEVILEFEKDGDFGITYSYGTYSYTYAGTWEWEDKKETIEVTVDSEILEWDVKKLTNDELWAEDEDNYLWEMDKL